MLTNICPGMWKEFNPQLRVLLHIMNITGPSVYNASAWFTLLHMVEAFDWTLTPGVRQENAHVNKKTDLK